ncbi:hypothetical protein PGSY75_1454800 [Plasmodium gaboni]|uniref:Pv-fam-g protein n=1 Tax=Plasmodium gaboni TaxID=647221 RepID=A0A151LB73_9APIC|nr:hypothetical protein PGSY75_1454800 [Plasmodium gaboni]KYN96137.1 hypothetical protein PGSY75_1454800 [Plasmodium gaboni]
MDNLFYYMIIQNDRIQPIIVRQPQTVIIHSQPQLPITLDLPPQNIILKNDDPQPIIVRQSNPNIIIEKSQNDFYNNPNFHIGLNDKANSISGINNTNIKETPIKDNMIEDMQNINNGDTQFYYNNQNVINDNNVLPTPYNYVNNGVFNKENNYDPYNFTLYSNK